MVLIDSGQPVCFGDLASNSVQLRVHNPRFYRDVVLGGTLGAAEAYIRGDWETDNLVNLLQFIARNTSVLSRFDLGLVRLTKSLAKCRHVFASNTVAGSKQNIAAHYDLSNDFFATFLDPTLTYSSGLFEDSQTTLADATHAKYERLCQLLELKPHDHLLEIGTGWGGFACYAAREYGCRVTTTTISQAQHDYAQQKIRDLGLQHRVELLQRDYRNLTGEYDKIVSIEMIEAVGHEFLPTFFGKCDQLLRPGGKFALQAITIPDQRYEKYRTSVDFIQRYIFPGGCLPSLGAMTEATGRTSLLLTRLDDFATDYARTLELWREKFHQNLDVIRQLGMSERLIRTWQYYFCYCEAGFREQLIGLKQMLYVKPGV